MASDRYDEQVRLLVQTLQVVAEHNCFALKGGTALNLFLRDMPRLSVDIDLVYLPINTRDEALAESRRALEAICDSIRRGAVANATGEVLGHRSDALRAVVRRRRTQIKIELSPVLRGTVLVPEKRTIAPAAADRYGHAEMLVGTAVDLYGGKICAALDRQHPRDLFDLKLLLDEDGLTRAIFEGFLVYLISHNRPIRELLAPRLADIRMTFVDQFQGMTRKPIEVEVLEKARDDLLIWLRDLLTPADCAFLLSVKRGEPDWAHLPYPHIHELPGVRWKLRNIATMSVAARQRELAALEQVLTTHYSY